MRPQSLTATVVEHLPQRGRMYLVRDVFSCKPGRAKELAVRLKRLLPNMETNDRFVNGKVMVDTVANYWTVVLEAEVESLADFEKHMAEFSQRPEGREGMSGYLDTIEGGYRELYRII